MWAGSFADALQQSSAALGLSPSKGYFPATGGSKPLSYIPPTLTEIHASFEQARQSQPEVVDARYALTSQPRRVTIDDISSMPSVTVQDELSQHASVDAREDQQEHPSAASSANVVCLTDSGKGRDVQQSDALTPEDAHVQPMSQLCVSDEAHVSPDNEYEQNPVSNAVGLTGCGASFEIPDDKPAWLTKLQNTWSNVMARADAAQQPISFFSADSASSLDLEEDSDSDSYSTEYASDQATVPTGFAYSPWPQPQAFSSAWQQASSQLKESLTPTTSFLAAAQGAAKQQASSTVSVLHHAGQWTTGLLKNPWQALRQPDMSTLQVISPL